MDKRKKRVKRIKYALIALFLFFLLLPTVLCFVLFYQMHKLSSEVEQMKLLKVMKVETEDAAKKELGEELKEGDGAFDSGMQAVLNQDFDQTGQELAKEEESGQENAAAEKQKADATDEVAGKKVYLTFDDGPGRNTEAILDILKEYGARATFFVVGKTDEHSIAMYKRIVEEGHTLGMHSYSHDYKKIYASLEDFKKDYDKISKLLLDAADVKPAYYRFPGGSSNLVSAEPISVFIDYLDELGITYYDWNVVSGDAVSSPLTARALYRNVINGVKKADGSVVLMHDLAGKETTVEALPMILKRLKKEGIAVLPINEDTTPIHHTVVGNERTG